MTWNVARMGKIRNEYNIFLGNLMGNVYLDEQEGGGRWIN
jgi:hypothetical protein